MQGKTVDPPVTIALRCPHGQRIADWNAGGLPIYVPGLAEVVKQCRGKDLVFYTTGEQAAIKEAGFILLGEHTHEVQERGSRARADLRCIRTWTHRGRICQLRRDYHERTGQ